MTARIYGDKIRTQMTQIAQIAQINAVPDLRSSALSAFHSVANPQWKTKNACN